MAELALKVALKGRDSLSRPLDKAAKAAKGLRGHARGAGAGLDRAAHGATGMGRGLKALSGRVSESAKRIRELERTGAEIDRFRTLKTAANDNAKALAVAREQTQALGRAMATGEGKTNKTAAAFRKARKNLAALEAKTLTATRAVGDQRAKLKDAGISTRELSSAQRALKRDLAQAQAAAEDQARALAKASQRAERLARTSARLRGLAGAFGKAAGAAHGLASRAAGVLAPLGAIGGVASLAGLSRLVSGFARSTDEIAKFARQTGFTAEGIQELQYAAERQGVSQEAFNTSIGAFSKRLGELRDGKGALAGLLKDIDPALGATLASASSSEDALAAMMGALEQIEDPQRRAALAAAAFGRSGMVMTRMAEAGADGLAALRAEARDLGAVVDNKTVASAEEFVDSLTRFQTAVSGLGKTIGARLTPVLKPVIDSLTTWIAANRDLIATRIEAVIARLADAVAAVDFAALGQSVTQTAASIGAAVEAVGGWENALIAVGIVLNAGLIVSVLKLGGGLFALAQGVLPLLIVGVKTLAATALPLLITGVKTLAATALPLLITGFKALTAAIISNPIGLIVVGVALAAGLIIANWEPIAAWFSDLWERVKQPLGVAWEWIKAVLDWAPLGMVIENWEPIAAWFSDLWERVKQPLGVAWEWIKTVLDWAPLGMVIENWEPIGAWFSDLWDSILAPFQDMIAFIEDKLGFLSGAVDSVTGLFGSFFSDDEDEEEEEEAGEGRSRAPAPPRARPFPAPVSSSGPVAAPAGASPGSRGARGHIVNRTITLNVTPPAGVDPQEVARLVMAALDTAEGGQADSARGRLIDDDD